MRQVYFNWRGDKVAPWNGSFFANKGTVSVNQRWRGDLFFVTKDGLPCSEFINYPPPPGSPGPLLDNNGQPWAMCAAGMSRNPLAFTYPVDRSYALAIWIPPGGFDIPGQVYLTMLEQRYVNVGGHGPITITVHDDRSVRCAFLCGTYNSTTHQYQYNAQNVPPKIVCPRLKDGWNYLAWTIKWRLDLSGGGSFYYRGANDSSWSDGDTFGGFPTALWNLGKNPPMSGSDLLNNYEFKVNSNFPMYYRRYIDCDRLSDAKALVAQI